MAKSGNALLTLILPLLIAFGVGWFAKQATAPSVDDPDKPGSGGPPAFRRARLFNGAKKDKKATATITGKVLGGGTDTNTVEATPPEDNKSDFTNKNIFSAKQIIDLMVHVTYDDKEATFSYDDFTNLDPGASERYVEISIIVHEWEDKFYAQVCALSGTDDAQVAPLAERVDLQKELKAAE